MKYYLGIDVGSGHVKAVLWDGLAIKAFITVPSGGDYRETARKAAENVLSQEGLSFSDVQASVATGYGSTMVDFCDRTLSDVTCHAMGIHYLLPTVRTVIDVGAQFSKAIRLDDNGRSVNFVMNEKCAGGSGKFLQVIARILRMSIEDIGQRSLTSAKPVEFTTGCAVFAESEAVSRIAEGASSEDILAGIHKAMAAKIANLVVRLGLVGDYALTGGGARDIGLVKAIESELGATILVPESPQVTAALGAAILAAVQPF